MNYEEKAGNQSNHISSVLGGNKWTHKEVEYLVSHPEKTYPEIAEDLGRSTASVSRKAQRMGLLKRGKRAFEQQSEQSKSGKVEYTKEEVSLEAIIEELLAIRNERQSSADIDEEENDVQENESDKGQKRQEPRDWSDEEVRLLFENQHETYEEIGKLLGRTKRSVRWKFRRMGIKKVKNPHTKYTVNEDYFKTWSDEMAYILGYIFDDGNVRSYENKAPKDLRITSKTRKILEKIRQKMHTNAKISKRTKISKNEKKVFTSGSKEFIKELHKQFSQRGINSTLMKKQNAGNENKYYQLKILAESREAFFKNLYNRSTIHMDRKYQVFEKFYLDIVAKRFIPCKDCRNIFYKRVHNKKRCDSCAKEKERKSKRKYPNGRQGSCADCGAAFERQSSKHKRCTNCAKEAEKQRKRKCQDGW